MHVPCMLTVYKLSYLLIEKYKTGIARRDSSSNTAILSHLYSGKFGHFGDRNVIDWRVKFDMSHVCITSILVIREHCELNHESPDGSVMHVM